MRKSVIEKNVEVKTELLRWIASKIYEGGDEPTWVKNHANLTHLSFSAKFWWSIIQLRIRPTFTDNVIILESTVLLANILAG